LYLKKTEDGKQYAEVLIKGGKTKPRTIPLIDSIPYVKDLICNHHPTPTNPNSWLFISKSNNTFGSKLTYDGITYQYKYFYKTKYFPKLLQDSTIPEADKAIIRNLLTKPWSLYIFRHSALTEKSLVLKEHVLRDHAGWTMSSKMPEIYLHYFGNESSKSLLEVKGIIKKKDVEYENTLKPKTCPNCKEPNKPDSQIFRECKSVLSIDSYNDIIKKQKEKDMEIKQLEERQLSKVNQLRAEMESKFQQLLLVIDPEKISKRNGL
jgi:hypothetical protein